MTNVIEIANTDPQILTKYVLQRLRLSPRSKESFKRSGVRPVELVFPTLSSFMQTTKVPKGSKLNKKEMA